MIVGPVKIPKRRRFEINNLRDCEKEKRFIENFILEFKH